MKKELPEDALADARVWLKSASTALAEAGRTERAEVVACAEAIHSIIRANDALTMALSGIKGTRHDDAPAVFKRLVREGKLEEKDIRFATLLFKAMGAKSGADYGRADITKKDATYFVSGAEEFIKMVESHLRRDSRPFR